MKFIQIWCGPKDALYDKYALSMDKMRELFWPNYERVFMTCGKQFSHPIIATDTKRIEIAAQTPDMLYADCDVEFYKVPEFILENRRPFFGSNKTSSVNHSVFYVNGNTNFFKSILNEREQLGMPFTFGWPMKIIRRKPINNIPVELYKHHEYTSTEIWRRYESGADNPWEHLGLYGRTNEWD